MRTVKALGISCRALGAIGFLAAAAAGGGREALAADPAPAGGPGTTAPRPPAAAPAATPPAGPATAPAPAAAPSAGTTIGTGNTTVTWWGHAAFVITTPQGATLAVDPWFENPSAPKSVAPPRTLDAILITHGHADHSGGAAQLAKRTGARVVAANELATLIGAEQSETMTPGGSIKIKDATIYLVEAVHSSGYNVDPKNVRYAGNPVGFVIAIDKGPTIYHAGDTDAFSSMALIADRYRPTLALLPIGGHYTMGPEGAAVAAKLLRVKTVVPMHFGTFPALAGTPAELRAELKRQHVTAKVVEMKPGDSLKL